MLLFSRLGGVWSQVRILSPRLESKGVLIKQLTLLFLFILRASNLKKKVFLFQKQAIEPNCLHFCEHIVAAWWPHGKSRRNEKARF